MSEPNEPAEPAEELPEDAEQTEDEEVVRRAVGRFRRMGRRLMDRKELAEDTRELLGAMLETSDKAKTEVVKLVAREVRTYLQELQVMDDLKDLATSHSLEFHVSMNLKPLAEAEDDLSSQEDVEDDEPSIEPDSAE